MLFRSAWDDIEIAYAKGGFLNIKLKNPDIYFKKKNSLQMLMIKGNLRLGYGHACISPQRLRKNSEKFIEEFQKRIKIEQ